MKRGRIAIIVAVVGLALLAGVLVSRYRPAEPEDSTGVQQVEGGSGATRAGESRKGPRGGKYFTADGFGLETVEAE